MVSGCLGYAKGGQRKDLILGTGFLCSNLSKIYPLSFFSISNFQLKILLVHAVQGHMNH